VAEGHHAAEARGISGGACRGGKRAWGERGGGAGRSWRRKKLLCRLCKTFVSKPLPGLQRVCDGMYPGRA
jgi:hypothetical protein